MPVNNVLEDFLGSLSLNDIETLVRAAEEELTYHHLDKVSPIRVLRSVGIDDEDFALQLFSSASEIAGLVLAARTPVIDAAYEAIGHILPNSNDRHITMSERVLGLVGPFSWLLKAQVSTSFFCCALVRMTLQMNIEDLLADLRTVFPKLENSITNINQLVNNVNPDNVIPITLTSTVLLDAVMHIERNLNEEVTAGRLNEDRISQFIDRQVAESLLFMEGGLTQKPSTTTIETITDYLLQHENEFDHAPIVRPSALNIDLMTSWIMQHLLVKSEGTKRLATA